MTAGKIRNDACLIETVVRVDVLNPGVLKSKMFRYVYDTVDRTMNLHTSFEFFLVNFEESSDQRNQTRRPPELKPPAGLQSKTNTATFI